MILTENKLNSCFSVVLIRLFPTSEACPNAGHIYLPVSFSHMAMQYFLKNKTLNLQEYFLPLSSFFYDSLSEDESSPIQSFI